MAPSRLAAIACATLSILAAQALAQAPDAGRILESIRQRAPVAPPAPERPVIELPAEAQRPAPGDGVRVRVQSFAFTGNEAIAAAELQAALDDLVGKELDLGGLQEAAARVTRLYRARGFIVARAYLPPQDIAGGRITVAVLEGVLGEVRIERAPGMRLSEARARGFLDVLRPGAPLRGDALDRALLLLSDLPGVAVRAQLRPGRQPGSADLVVRLDEGRALEGRGSVDNHGNRYTGRIRTTAELALNDRFGLGEQFTLRGIVSAEGLTAFSAGLALPLGESGLRAGLGVSQLDYKVGRELAPLRAGGNANVQSAWLAYPLLRGRDANLWAQANLENKRFHDNVESTDTTTIRNSRLLTIGLNGNWRDGLLGGLGGARNGASLQFGSGELRRESAADAAFDAVSARSAVRFEKLNYSYSRLQQLGGSWSFLGAVSGQRASKNLDSSEKFYLGGPAGVRAYAQGEGAGDEGWLATLELRHALGEVGGFIAEASLFHDAGRVQLDRNAWDPTQASNQRKLAGTGFGLTLARPRALAISLGLAFKSSGAPPTLAEPARGRQFWIQVNALPQLGASGTGAAGRSDVKFETYGSIGLMAERVSRDGATPAGPRIATQALSPTGQNLPAYARVRDPTSYAGLRGSAPLIGGTDFFWQAETGFTYQWNDSPTGDDGAGANTQGVSLRDTAAGVRHARYGSLLFGKWDTPMKESTQALDPFGGNYIASHTNLIGSPGFGAGGATSFGPLSRATDSNNDDAGFNRRHSGIWQYWTPEWRGFGMRFAYANNKRRAAPDVGEGRLWGASATWKVAGFTLVGAYERHDNYFGIASLGRNNRGVGSDAAASVTAGTTSRDWSARGGVMYGFGATQISLMADRLAYAEFGVIPAATVPDLQSYKRSAWVAAIQHQLGALELRASYGEAGAGHCAAISGDPAQQPCTTSGLGAKMVTLGFQYALVKDLTLYGHYARIANDATASYNFSVHGVFAAPGRAPGVGSDPEGYGVGLKYSF